ncbi:hypothetical protein BsWGS_24188 [Bradybaena similaris]
MEDTDDQSAPHVCSIFESQTWRKSLCKNCFHTLEEHSEELLAKEAEVVAKEKAAGRTSVSGAKISTAINSKNMSSVGAKNLKKTGSSKELEKTDKEKSPKDVKGKVSVNKDSGKEDSKPSVSKDIGRENKTTRQGTLEKNANEKHSAVSTTTSTSSISSLTTTTGKSPLKQVKSPPAAITNAAPAQTATTNSITSVTSGTNSAASSQKSSVSTASGTNAASNSQKTPVSKAKNTTSTIEPKPPVSSKDKLPKLPDTPTKNPSIQTTNTKSVNNPPGSKLSDKSADSPQSPLPKGDSKSPRKAAEETKLTDTISKNSKGGHSKTTTAKPVEVKNENCLSGDTSKDTKTPPPASKPESKDLKLINGNRSKTPLFSKDSLKNVKDATKQIKSSLDPGENKTNLPQIKDDRITNTQDSSKVSANATNEKVKVTPGFKNYPAKINDIKGKQQDNESALKSSSKLKSAEASLTSSTIEHKNASIVSNQETVESNKSGQLGKALTKSAGANTLGNAESKETLKSSKATISSKRESSPFSSPSKAEADKCVNSKDLGKEKAAGISSERKQEPAADFSVVGKKPLTSFSMTQSSRSATPSLTDTKSTPSTLPAKSGENKTPKTLKLDTTKESKPPASSLDKSKVSEKMKDKSGDKGASIFSVKSPTSAQTPKTREECKEVDKEATPRKQLVDVKDASRLTAELKDKEATSKKQFADVKDVRLTAELKDKEVTPRKQLLDVKDATRLTAELKDKEAKLEAMAEQLSKMIKQMRVLEEERDQLKGSSSNNHKKDTETILVSLREQLSNLESQCKALEKDNLSLIDQLHVQEATVKPGQGAREEILNNSNLEEDLEAAEQELDDAKEANKELQTQIMEMKCEMDEMYDHFRENEHEEFREMQKELDMTAKSCRILQFKLRKAERRNEQFEEERIRYEEKLRMLQDQFDSKDAKDHIRILEEELRIAKEVSVRLHDELDIVEDKRNKVLDDNRHLTDLLEHTDRRQFRLEMEIDKLRDIVSNILSQFTCSYISFAHLGGYTS